MRNTTRDKIRVFFQVTNLIILLVLGYIGTSINAHLADIQSSDNKRATASDANRFWKEVSALVPLLSSRGVELANAIIASEQDFALFVKAYKERKGKLKGEMDYWEDPELSRLYTSFFEWNNRARALIDRTLIDYDELRLRYTPLAIALNVEGWDKFYKADKAMSKWAINEYEFLNETSNLVREIVFEGKDNVNIDIESRAFMVGYKSMGVTPPLREELLELMKSNLDVYEIKNSK